MTETERLSELVHKLGTPWTGHFVGDLSSTQDEARRLIREHAAPWGTLVVADVQRAGRGRQDRVWLARPGQALLLSLVVRERTHTPVPWRWTCVVSLSLVEAIERLIPGATPAIKWPNDVLLGDAKVAGVLAETTWDGTELVVIIGLGVNVTTDCATLRSVGHPATSLYRATGERLDRSSLLLALLERFRAWSSQPWMVLHPAWAARLWGRGQRVRLNDLGGDAEVVVLGVQPDGALRVRLPDGTERSTLTGELIP